MRDFIRSLSKDQLKGLVEFQRNRASSGIATIIEDHLNGRSDDYNLYFGNGNAKEKQVPSVTAEDTVRAYLANKKATIKSQSNQK